MKFRLSIKKDGNWSLWGILLIAFLFRFLYLALKPPHFDEGINGWFVDQLISKGYYAYDPTNYHGPFHFYVLLFFKFLMGRNLWALRVPASIFGLLGVYLIAKLEPYVGRFTAFVAALFVAVSPGMVFYTRYAIHESELLFFSLLALHGFLRYRTRKDAASVWFMGLGLVGMIITKETFVIHVACFGMAWLCLRLYEKFLNRTAAAEAEIPVARQFNWIDVGTVGAACVLIFVAFYSGFFLHWQGVEDFFRSFAPWFHTGQKGNGHEKPFYYWFTLLWRYEWVAMAGLVLSLKLLFPATRWLRLIGIYGVGVFLAYSIVPYKTPWCILNIVWPFYLIAASIIGDLFAHREVRARQLMLSVVALLTIVEGAKSIDLNFFQYTNEKEPYVYVQTFSDIMGITDKLLTLAQKDPRNYHMPIKIFLSSQWPIPWLWGDFTQVGYYGKLLNIDPNADLILVDAQEQHLLESKLTKSYYVQPFRLRSAQDPGFAYFDVDKFKGFFDEKTQIFRPAPPEPLKAGQGLLAEYYQNGDWIGQPVMKKVVPKPDFYIDDVQRPLPAPWSALFSGEILIPESGPRTFYLSSDDGSELWIDGKSVVENLGAHPNLLKVATASFKKGWHKIRIRYNDFGGGMVLNLMWSNAQGAQEEIGSQYFRVKDLQVGAP